MLDPPRACTRDSSCTLTGAKSARNSRVLTCSTVNGFAGSAAGREAREHLRTARDMLEAMGMGGVRRQRAGGGAARRRRDRPQAHRRRQGYEELTAQEAHIARAGW